MKSRDADLLELQAFLLPMLEPLAEVGSWTVAFFHPNGDHIEVNWKTRDFPSEDFDTCVDLLKKELTAEREAILARMKDEDNEN